MSTALVESGALWIKEEFVPDSQELFEQLLASVAWDERMRARKTASFGLPYNYSGITYPAVPFPEFLLPLVVRLREILGYGPNNCLVNYYQDGNSTMGFHSDSTDELETGTGIAIVALRAERTITFRNQRDRQIQERYSLRPGSLLYMTPDMQREWKHAILTHPDVGERISLTFRRIQDTA